MAQRPPATSVTEVTVPTVETVQVVAVVDAKSTARPDEAVAETGNGAVPKGSFGNVPNVMVCGVVPTMTRKVLGTGAAGK